MTSSREYVASALEIGHELRVHLHGRRAAAARGKEPADERFDAGVDVRAVERRDAGIDEAGHVVERGRLVDRAVAAGQLPAALDDA